MTTLHPAQRPPKTRADAVVIGVVPGGPKGLPPRRVARRVAAAFGRVRGAARRARRHRQGRRGDQGADRRQHHHRRCWSWSASGEPPRTDRPASYAARPVPRSARSRTPPRSRWRCPRHDDAARPRRRRGRPARRLRVHRYKSGADPQATRPRSSCSPTPRARRAPRRPSTTARIVAEAITSDPRLGEHPAGRPHPESFADAVVAETKAARPPRSRSRCSTSRQLRRRRLRRHARRRPGLGEPAAAGQLTYAPQGAPRRTSPWSARASPSTPAACDQARRQHDRR